MIGLKSTIFYNSDYRDIPNSQLNDSVIYCDPPYADTTNYSNSSDFDHEYFWEWCRKNSKKNLIFISEYSAPKDFIKVWSKPQVIKIDARKKENIFTKVDKLFVHESNYDKIQIL